jgi:hypothetical protein
MEYQHQIGGTAEDGPAEVGPRRPASELAPIAAPRSPMIVSMDRPLNQRWFPLRDARPMLKAATMRRSWPMVSRGGCIVILA